MSCCRWSEGDLYAYRASDGYIVHVAARCVGGSVREMYVEPSAQALLAASFGSAARDATIPGMHFVT